MLKNNYIITGIPPTGLSGTGDLLLFLKKNIKLKIAWRPVSFLSAIKILFKSTYKRNCDIQEIYKSLLVYLITIYPLVKFKKLRNIRDINLYLFHPQSISYEFVNRMTDLKIIKGIYILDNSYFCFASYNWLKTEPLKACTMCIQNKNNFIIYGCKDIFRNEKDQYKIFRDNLYRGFLGKIFVQNYSHKKIFSLVSNGKGSVIAGMLPQSLINYKKDIFCNKEEYYFNILCKLKKKYKFIVVCHMNFSGAKGYFLIEEVSRYLKDICFIFPFKKPSIIGDEKNQKNLIYLPCSWDSGLRNLCNEADMVFVPSIWTIQVEGALLKSCLVAKRLVSISDSIIDKRDYLQGIYYLSTSDGIEKLARRILDVLQLSPNRDILISSLKKYISQTTKNLEKLFN